MLVKDIMTRTIVSVAPDATVAEALDLMSRSHISGLPVVDAAGSLVGIVSEADFLRRWEIGTHGSSAGWLKALLAPGSAAQTYAKTHARHVAEMMTRDVVSIDESAGLAEAVALMEKRRVKRLLVTRDGDLTGILSRADFIRALALFVRQAYEEEIVSDASIADEIQSELRRQEWAPAASIEVEVKNGEVSLRGCIVDERQRDALKALAESARGVRAVHDHMLWAGPFFGPVLASPEDEAQQKRAAIT